MARPSVTLTEPEGPFMARRILNRKDLRADYDAAEARRKDEEERDEDEEVEEEEEDEAEASDEDEEAGDEDDEEAPAKKKKKAPVKEAKPKRVRTPKVVRMRVIWGVFNNSNQCVARYDYPKKGDAEEHAKKLMAEKKQTFFIQPIKEQIEEKKEK
jgi:hypothetical protein